MGCSPWDLCPDPTSSTVHGASPNRAAEGSEQVDGDFAKRMAGFCHPLMSAQCKEQSKAEKPAIASLCGKVLAENFWLRLLDSLTVLMLGSKAVPRCVFCPGETSLWCPKGLFWLDGVALSTVLKR